MGSEHGESRTRGVESQIGVPKRVALHGAEPLWIHFSHDVPLRIEVADIEHLLIWQAHLPPGLDVRFHVIKGPKLRRVADLSLVIESRVAEHENTMLEAYVSTHYQACVYLDQSRSGSVITSSMASWICLMICGGTGLEKSTPRTSAQKVSWSGVISI